MKKYRETKEQFRQLALAGVPYKTIALALGISHGCVFYWRGECGIDRRKRGPKAKKETT
jgi:transposase-like protein